LNLQQEAVLANGTRIKLKIKNEELKIKGRGN
jgi:hypothetical protein